jgi:hypothetical protein
MSEASRNDLLELSERIATTDAMLRALKAERERMLHYIEMRHLNGTKARAEASPSLRHEGEETDGFDRLDAAVDASPFADLDAALCAEYLDGAPGADNPHDGEPPPEDDPDDDDDELRADLDLAAETFMNDLCSDTEVDPHKPVVPGKSILVNRQVVTAEEINLLVDDANIDESQLPLITDYDEAFDGRRR